MLHTEKDRPERRFNVQTNQQLGLMSESNISLGGKATSYWDLISFFIFTSFRIFIFVFKQCGSFHFYCDILQCWFFLEFVILKVIVQASNRSKVFCEESVLKNLTKFRGKSLCWSHFVIELQAWRTLYLKNINICGS